MIGQSIIKNNKKPKPKQCYKCGEKEHIKTDSPNGDKPKAEQWINNQNGMSAHHKATALILLERGIKG